MVRQCFVCGNCDKKGSNVSFHKLPKNTMTKQLWLSRLNIISGSLFPKYLYICSDHFNAGDFLIKPSGLKYLKEGVMPSIYSPSQQLIEVSVDDSMETSQVLSVTVSDDKSKMFGSENVITIDDDSDSCSSIDNLHSSTNNAVASTTTESSTIVTPMILNATDSAGPFRFLDTPDTKPKLLFVVIPSQVPSVNNLPNVITTVNQPNITTPVTLSNVITPDKTPNFLTPVKVSNLTSNVNASSKGSNMLNVTNTSAMFNTSTLQQLVNIGGIPHVLKNIKPISADKTEVNKGLNSTKLTRNRNQSAEAMFVKLKKMAYREMCLRKKLEISKGTMKDLEGRASFLKGLLRVLRKANQSGKTCVVPFDDAKSKMYQPLVKKILHTVTMKS